MDLDDLLGRAVVRRALAGHGRALLGITGAPGAGKSTLAAALVRALPGRAVLVPMDGFHLHDDVLHRLGRSGRKGAPDTFDAAGYVHLLRRLRDPGEQVVYAPRFDRERETSLAGAVAVPAEVPLVVTEGNYLLGGPGFGPVRGLLDEVWFLDVDPAERRRRLLDRHVRHGRTPQQAEAWVAAVDVPNADLVEATRDGADLQVELG